MTALTDLTRRGFLASGSVLIVSFAIGRAPGAVFAQSGPAAGPGGGVGPAAVLDRDGFIAIRADGSVTLYTSHVAAGSGLSTAYREIAAAELDIPVERVTVIEGDTLIPASTCRTGGSSGVPPGAADIRCAAAAARQALLDLGAAALGHSASELTIADGMVGAAGARSGTRVTVAALISGKRFSLELDPNPVLACPVASKPILRSDEPAKASGRRVFIQVLHPRYVPASVSLRADLHRSSPERARPLDEWSRLAREHRSAGRRCRHSLSSFRRPDAVAVDVTGRPYVRPERG